jgi:YVTN family beta-propeller protein
MDPNSHRAYVTDLGPGKLTVIDTRTCRVSSTVSLGSVGTDPYAAAATNHAVYVVNQGANTLSVIDPRTLKVLAKVKTGKSPSGVAVAQAGRRNT